MSRVEAELRRARAADAQARRIAQLEFVRPILLEAGAGTGKTTTLVARVLAWALGPGWVRAEAALRAQRREGDPPPEPDRIAARVMGGVVAITFTEAAAANMAAKVGEGLALLEGGVLPTGLVAEAVPLREKALEERAGALLSALDQLVVRTIHAWCRRLLSTWPLEAGLHPRFEVDADGEALSALCREVVESRLKVYYSDPGDPDCLDLASRGFGPQELVEALETLAREAMPARALEEDPVSPVQVRLLCSRIQPRASILSRLLESRLAGASRGRLKNAFALQEALARLAEELDAPQLDLEAVQRLIGEHLPENLLQHLEKFGRGDFGKSEAELFETAQAEIREPARHLARLARHVSKLDGELLSLGTAVMRPLLAEVERLLRSRGVETFSAMLRDARDLLLRRPDVTGRVRAEIDQLLVDEFQDTDRVQCDVVRLLALEGPEEERPGLFLVGDPKQSIYGWRSADLAAYEGFKRQVEQAGGLIASLVENYRSTPLILDEVTRVHDRVMRPEPDVQPAHVPLVPSEKTAESPGFSRAPWAAVEYWLSWSAEPNQDGPAKKTRAEDASLREALSLASDLVRLRREHAIPWSEVAILLRGTTHLDLVLRELRNAGVPYAVERDKNYYRRREIIDASAFVRCILDPNDHLALLTVLRSPVVGVPDAALIPLWTHGLPGLLSELHAPEARQLAEIAEAVRAAARELPPHIPGIEGIASWEEGLIATLAGVGELRESLEHLPADRWVERLRARFLIEATEAARFHGQYRLANLERFFRALTEALERDGGDPQALLRSLRRSVAEAREAEEARPKETAGEAVQVMTIHKSKGLDFKHVYVLQTSREGRGGGKLPLNAAALSVPDPAAPLIGGERWEYRLFGASTLGWDQVLERQERVERAERVRTLYVAMTRAKDRLVLAGDLPLGVSELAEASTHADLLSLRGLPPLDQRFVELAEARAGDRLEEDGASWVFLAMQTERLDGLDEGPARWDSPDPARVAAEQARLRAARREAEALERRPLGGGVGAETHEQLRASVAERRFAEDRAGDDGLGAGGSEKVDLKERLAVAVQSALHRVLETFDARAGVAVEVERQRERLAGYLRALVGPDDLHRAEERAAELLDRVAEGPLLHRLAGLGDRVLARALPLLLPAEAALAEEGQRPVGFATGAVDLLYRDPLDEGLVLVDYVLDPAPFGEDALGAACRALAALAGPAQDALEAALGERPRLELWFLQDGIVSR